MSASRLESFLAPWGRAGAVLALLGAPLWAQASEATVTFGGPGVAPPFMGEVFAQGNQHIDNATFTADYSGVANLASGAMAANVAATPHSTFLGGPVAASSSWLYELIRVVGPGTVPVPVQMRMDISALMTVDSSMGASDGVELWLSALMSIDTSLSSSMEIRRRKTYLDTGAINEDSIECVGQPCNLNQPLTTAGVIDGQLILNFNMTPGFYSAFVAYTIVSTSSNPEVFGQVETSQHISYVLPPGYKLDSQSGVFLTAVPEPATALLALLGGAVLALRARAAGPRRRCD